MSFRARLTLAVALAVAVAVVVASAITFVLVRNELRGQVDDALRERASTGGLALRFDRVTGEPQLDLPPDRFGGAAGITQVVTDSGEAIRAPEALVELPVSERARRTASGGGGPFFTDAHVSGKHLRVYTTPVNRPGLALQVARPLDEVDAALDRIKTLLFLIAASGVAIAAGLGLVLSKALLAPVQRLTRTAEEVSETRDLSRRIDATGSDELSRLAATFNTMLGALEESARAQRRLVSDASHELRTPLTSLRTNIEVLAKDEAMPLGRAGAAAPRRHGAVDGDDGADRRARRAGARRRGARRAGRRASRPRHRRRDRADSTQPSRRRLHDPTSRRR